MKLIYIIGSLRNPQVPVLERELIAQGFDVFAEWYGAGEHADDAWQAYQDGLGHSYTEALASYAAQMVFNFDKTHLTRCDMVVMLMPTGKSGHLELGYARGLGKPGYILMDKKPKRYDVMYNFASGVFFNKADLFAALQKES
jgi:nucleoside 2-deoxyribosyltransferase